jgi:hypothetical protein
LSRGERAFARAVAEEEVLVTEQLLWTHFEGMVCDSRRIIMLMARNPTRYSSFRLVERGVWASIRELSPPDHRLTCWGTHRAGVWVGRG